MTRPKESFADIKTTIKNAVKELLEDEEFLSKVAEKVSLKVNEKLQLLEQKVDDLQKQNKQLKYRVNELDQYSRRNNLRIFNVNEQTEEELNKTIIKLCKDKLKLTIKDHEIENCYRTGLIKPNINRPIFLKLNSYNTKQSIIQNRKLLKGSKVSIVEDLTKEKLDLLKACHSCLGRDKVWIYNGKIMTNLNNKYQEIKDDDHCKQLAENKQ